MIPLGVAIGGQVAGQLASAYMQERANQLNAKLARETNELNYKMSQEQTAFQERMSNTAYQRSMADMKSAGLNPMLAFQQGGASTPSGASIAAQQPSTMESVDLGKALTLGVNSARDTQKLNQDLKGADSQMALNQASQENMMSQRELNLNSAKKTAIETETAKAELPSKKARAQADEATARIDKEMTKFDAVNKRAQATLGNLNSAKDLITPKFKLGIGQSIIDHKGEILREGPKQENPLYRYRKR